MHTRYPGSVTTASPAPVASRGMSRGLVAIIAVATGAVSVVGAGVAARGAVIFLRCFGPTTPRAVRVALALVCAVAFTLTVGFAGGFLA